MNSETLIALGGLFLCIAVFFLYGMIRNDRDDADDRFDRMLKIDHWVGVLRADVEKLKGTSVGRKEFNELARKVDVKKSSAEKWEREYAKHFSGKDICKVLQETVIKSRGMSDDIATLYRQMINLFAWQNDLDACLKTRVAAKTVSSYEVEDIRKEIRNMNSKLDEMRISTRRRDEHYEATIQKLNEKIEKYEKTMKIMKTFNSANGQKLKEMLAFYDLFGKDFWTPFMDNGEV